MQPAVVFGVDFDCESRREAHWIGADLGLGGGVVRPA